MLKLKIKQIFFHTRFLHDIDSKHFNAEGSPRCWITETCCDGHSTTAKLCLSVQRVDFCLDLAVLLMESAAQYWSYIAQNMTRYQWWEHAAHVAELLLEGCFNHETSHCWSYNPRQEIKDENMMHIKSSLTGGMLWLLRLPTFSYVPLGVQTVKKQNNMHEREHHLYPRPENLASNIILHVVLQLPVYLLWSPCMLLYCIDS